MDQAEFKRKMEEEDFEKLSNKELRKLVKYCLHVDEQSKENKKLPDGTSRLIILMEELAELSQEISKYIRKKGDREHIIEEIADVEISLDYIKCLLNMRDEELDHAKRIKADRLKCGTEAYLTEYEKSHPKKKSKNKKKKGSKKDVEKE